MKIFANIYFWAGKLEFTHRRFNKKNNLLLIVSFFSFYKLILNEKENVRLRKRREKLKNKYLCLAR